MAAEEYEGAPAAPAEAPAADEVELADIERALAGGHDPLGGRSREPLEIEPPHEGNDIRDIYVTRLVNQRWTTPVAVHNDGWRVQGCPVNGPAISARGREVAVAWFTAKGEQGRTFVAFSRDAGRTFGAPVRVDDVSSLGRVGVALLADGSAAVTWVEFSAEHSQFRVRRVDARGDGAAGAKWPAADIAEASGTRYPRLAQVGDELLFAWTATEDGSPRVSVARAPLPPAPR